MAVRVCAIVSRCGLQLKGLKLPEFMAGLRLWRYKYAFICLLQQIRQNILLCLIWKNSEKLVVKILQGRVSQF